MTRREIHRVWGAALATQIKLLERDFGQPLLKRAERGHPMKLTPFGMRVAAAVEGLSGSTWQS